MPATVVTLRVVVRGTIEEHQGDLDSMSISAPQRRLEQTLGGVLKQAYLAEAIVQSEHVRKDDSVLLEIAHGTEDVVDEVESLGAVALVGSYHTHASSP